jgi:tape measure domain-containing protein
LIVRELITRLGFSLNQAQLNNAEKATERVKDRAEQAAAAFRNIVTAVASLATVKAIINIGDEMQSIRTRIGQLPQTVGEAGDAFDEVAKRASASGVKIEAYSSLYTKVGNAAKDYIKTQEDLLGITDTISQALVVGGASTQEASAVMTQFSQALASGVLQGDEFRSMAEAAPQYLDKLAETMKIPREQLKKMASDGKLTAKAVIEATRQMSSYFGDKFKEMPMTVGRAMTVVSNRFALMIDRMNRESLFITRLANFILAAFDKIETGVYSLVKTFGGFENMMRFVGIAISVALGAKALSILSAFRAASLLTLLPFLKMAAIITAVTLVLEDLYVWIQGGDSLIGKFAGNWEDVKDKVIGVASAIAALGSAFLLWKTAVVGFTVALRVYEGVLLAVAAAKRGLVIVAFALNAVMALNPVGLVALAVAALIAGLVALVVYWDTVKGWISSFFSWAMDKFAALGAFVASLFEGDFLQNLKGVLSSAWTAITTTLGDAFASVVSYWSGLITSVGDAFMSMFDAVASFVTDIFENIGKMIVGVFTLDPQLFMEGLQGYTNTLLSVLPEWGQAIILAFANAFASVVSYFATTMTQLGAMIYQAIFAPIVAAVTDAWNAAKSVVTGIGDKASGAWQATKTFFGAGDSAAPGTGGAMGAANTLAPSVAPAQLAPSAMGAAKPSISSNTTVNVTVPQGTSAEQTAYLQKAAQQSFSKQSDDKLARDLAVYAP